MSSDPSPANLQHSSSAETEKVCILHLISQQIQFSEANNVSSNLSNEN